MEEGTSDQGVRFKFNGNGGIYFKIWIVNILLTIVTLGIYSAWAKIRTRKYFWNSLELEGSSFDYHARPIPILIGRIVSIILLGLYFGGSSLSPVVGVIGIILATLLFPILFIKSFQFNVNNTSFKNIRFHFKPDLKKAMKVYLKYITIPMIYSVATTLMNLSGTQEGTTENAEFTLATAMILFGFIFLMVYTVVIAAPFLNEIFDYIYNRIYYGGTKINLDTTKKEVSKQITKPYFIFLIVGTIIGIAIIFGATLLFSLALGEASKIIIPFLFIGFYGFLLYATLKLPYLVTFYLWNKLKHEDRPASCDLKWADYSNLAIKNTLLAGLTMGLYYPFAKIKMTDLKWSSRSIVMGDLDQIVANASQSESAVLEEITDSFDFDFDIGI